MNTVNIKLLNETLDYIIEHPEEWNQGDWRCGTTMCFAGWACSLSGAALVSPEPQLPYWRLYGINSSQTREQYIEWVNPRGDWSETQIEMNVDYLGENRDTEVIPAGLTEAEKLSISTYATEALGLDSVSADILFGSRNSLHELREMIEVLEDKGTLIGTEWDHFEDEDYDDYDEDYCDECHSSCSCCCTCTDEDDE